MTHVDEVLLITLNGNILPPMDECLYLFDLLNSYRNSYESTWNIPIKYAVYTDYIWMNLFFIILSSISVGNIHTH